MEALYSKMVRAGRTTFFLDVWKAGNGSKYITITASAPSASDPKKFKKHSIILFDTVAQEFSEALKDTIDKMK